MKRETAVWPRIIWASAAVVGFVVAREAYERASQWLHREPSVSSATVAQPWVEQHLDRSSVAFSAPWAMNSKPASLPPEVVQAVTSATQLEHEEDGIVLGAAHLVMKVGEPSIDGAVDGALQKIKGLPGTASVASTTRETLVIGRRCVDIDARIERQGGSPLEMHAAIFGDGADLYQLMVVYAADDSNGRRAWERIRSSIHRSRAEPSL
jgi:hypothetical protein